MLTEHDNETKCQDYKLDILFASILGIFYIIVLFLGIMKRWKN